MNVIERLSSAVVLGITSLAAQGCAHVARTPQHEQSNVKTAPQLLDDYTRLVSAGEFEQALELFAPDAVFEFPFFPSVGIGGHLVGRDAIRAQVGDFLINQTENFSFHDIKIWPAADPNRAFGEYSATTKIKATGRRLQPALRWPTRVEGRQDRTPSRIFKSRRRGERHLPWRSAGRHRETLEMRTT